MLVRFDDGTLFIVNADHSIMRPAVLVGIAECITGSWFGAD